MTQAPTNERLRELIDVLEGRKFLGHTAQRTADQQTAAALTELLAARTRPAVEPEPKRAKTVGYCAEIAWDATFAWLVNTGRPQQEAQDAADAVREHVNVAALEAPLSPPASKPDDDGWIEWKGGECPIPPNQLHQRKYRQGTIGDWITPAAMGSLDYWDHRDKPGDIIAYRLSPKHEDGNAGKAG